MPEEININFSVRIHSLVEIGNFLKAGSSTFDIFEILYIKTLYIIHKLHIILYYTYILHYTFKRLRIMQK